MDNKFLSQLKSLPDNAVFGLISDSSKECYISHTNNLKARIGQILSSDFILHEDTRLIVFNTVHDSEYKRIYTQYYLDKYKELGYSRVGGPFEYINYKVRVQYSKFLLEALVVLINKRKDKTVVGVFSSVEEANKFVDEYYTGKDIVLPVYSINKRTVEWISTHKDI